MRIGLSALRIGAVWGLIGDRGRGGRIGKRGTGLVYDSKASDASMIDLLDWAVGVRAESLFRLQGARSKEEGARSKVPGARCQVPGARCPDCTRTARQVLVVMT